MSLMSCQDLFVGLGIRGSLFAWAISECALCGIVAWYVAAITCLPRVGWLGSEFELRSL